MDIYPVFHADTASRGLLCIAVVMVPPHIQHRDIRKRCQKRQIICVQVPTGEYQVNPLKLIFLKIIP